MPASFFMRFGTPTSPMPSSRIEWSISWKKASTISWAISWPARADVARAPEIQDQHGRQHLETAHHRVGHVEVRIEVRLARRRWSARILPFDDRADCRFSS